MADNKRGYTAQDYVRAVQEHGTQRAAAKALGINARTLTRGLARVNDPAIEAAMHAVGTNLPPVMTWIKTKANADGLSHSVLVRPPPVDDDILDRIRKAFEGMDTAPPVRPPEQVATDLCNVFPLFDVHFGMHAWGLETASDDYSTKLAASDIRRAFEKVLRLVPDAEQALIIIGGDFFHADDTRAETPSSRHKLDVDGRHHKVIAEAIEAPCAMPSPASSPSTGTHISGCCPETMTNTRIWSSSLRWRNTIERMLPLRWICPPLTC
jgi:hypothetical protein